MHSFHLERNLSYAQFVLQLRKNLFPLGGINREDFHQQYPEIYKDQLMIAIAIRLIEGGSIAFLKSRHPSIVDCIIHILEKNHYFVEELEDIFEILDKKILLELLKKQLKGWFCDELCSSILHHIKKMAPQIPIQLGKLPYHHLLLIGDLGNLQDLVVCDPWSEAIYPFLDFQYIQKHSPDIPTVWFDEEEMHNEIPHYLSGKLQTINVKESYLENNELMIHHEYGIVKIQAPKASPLEIISTLYSEKSELPASQVFVKKETKLWTTFFNEKLPKLECYEKDTSKSGPEKFHR